MVDRRTKEARAHDELLAAKQWMLEVHAEKVRSDLLVQSLEDARKHALGNASHWSGQYTAARLRFNDARQALAAAIGGDIGEDEED